MLVNPYSAWAARIASALMCLHAYAGPLQKPMPPTQIGVTDTCEEESLATHPVVHRTAQESFPDLHPRLSYEVRPVGDEHQAHNPRQAWNTQFDGRGFLTVPNSSDWTWGLDLIEYGQGSESRTIDGAASVCSEGERVTYDWGAGLEEWYINDLRGLEHGYTLQERPFSGDGPLTMTLAVRGGLRPVVVDEGRTIHFVRERSELVLSYAGLTVLDARGGEYPAAFEANGTHLTLRVHEAGAHYPLTIDPIAQQAYLKAPFPDENDRLGIAMALSGETLVVSATGESSSASTVNGDAANNLSPKSGAAYVYVRNGVQWSMEAYLKASDSATLDEFGSALAIDGNTIAVGTHLKDNGTGAVYIFVRSGSTWTEQAKLQPAFVSHGDWFGASVALSGETLVVGSPSEDSIASQSGAANVFVRNGTSWTHQGVLKASNPGVQDWFGWTVSFSEDTLVVGAHGEDGGTGGVNPPDGNGIPNSGAAYVFVRSGNSWTQQAKLKASNPGPDDAFGREVVMFGDRVFASATGEGSASPGIDGDQNDNSMMSAGAVYGFTRTGSQWSQEVYIKASNPGAVDVFGYAMAMSGTTLVVTADREGGSAVGVNGTPNDNASLAGAAYVFDNSGGTWVQEAYLKASNTDAFDLFGKSVAASPGILAVGAVGEDSDGSSQSDDSLSESGAVYTFEFDYGTTGSAYCFGDGSGNQCPCGNGATGAGCPSSSTTGAVLTGSGQARFAMDSFGLSVTDLPPGKPGLCVKGWLSLGNGDGNPIGDGFLCTAPQLRSQVLVSNGAGTVTMADWRGQPFGTYPGAANTTGATYYQWWYRDVANPCTGAGFNFSNGWRVTWL